MWDKLFKKALYILDTAKIPECEWTFGGGTALALRFQHRESQDIDIFLTNAQYLTLLTPRLNKIAAGMTDDYTEGSSFLKLRFSEGEVDFIIAPRLTRNPYEIREVIGKSVQVETPEEIVLKKLFYSTEALKVRDVVDVAVVYRERKEQLLEQVHILASKYESMKYRWNKLQKTYSAEVTGLKILDLRLINEAPALFNTFLVDIGKLFIR